MWHRQQWLNQDLETLNRSEIFNADLTTASPPAKSKEKTNNNLR